MLLRSVVLLVCGWGALTAHGSGVARGQGLTIAPIDRLELWARAIEEHQAGVSDASLVRVAAWPHHELSRLLPYVEALLVLIEQTTAVTVPPSPNVLLPRPSGPGRPLPRLSAHDVERVRALASRDWLQSDRNGFLKRAALLHTDVAILVPAQPDVLAGRGQRPTARQLSATARERILVSAPDADLRGIQFGSVHWDFARTLLDAVTPSPSLDADVRDWYRATGAYLARWSMFGEARPHSERGIALFPDDPLVLFNEACMNEALASPGVQDFIRETRLPGGLMFDVQPAVHHLRIAEAFFGRASDADPGFAEARVRRALVLAALGLHAEAMALLRDPVPETADPVVSYYALLVRARVATAVADEQGALAAYESASALFPQAQTPLIAIGLLAQKLGEAAMARAASARLFALAGDATARHDPWWDYHRGHGRSADARLQQIRQTMGGAARARRTP